MSRSWRSSGGSSSPQFGNNTSEQENRDDLTKVTPSDETVVVDKDGIVSGACEAQEERRSFRWERSFHNVLAPTNDISEGECEAEPSQSGAVCGGADSTSPRISVLKSRRRLQQEGDPDNDQSARGCFDQRCGSSASQPHSSDHGSSDADSELDQPPDPHRRTSNAGPSCAPRSAREMRHSSLSHIELQTRNGASTNCDDYSKIYDNSNYNSQQSSPHSTPRSSIGYCDSKHNHSNRSNQQSPRNDAKNSIQGTPPIRVAAKRVSSIAVASNIGKATFQNDELRDPPERADCDNRHLGWAANGADTQGSSSSSTSWHVQRAVSMSANQPPQRPHHYQPQPQGHPQPQRSWSDAWSSSSSEASPRTRWRGGDARGHQPRDSDDAPRARGGHVSGHVSKPVGGHVSAPLQTRSRGTRTEAEETTWGMPFNLNLLCQSLQGQLEQGRASLGPMLDAQQDGASPRLRSDTRRLSMRTEPARADAVPANTTSEKVYTDHADHTSWSVMSQVSPLFEPPRLSQDSTSSSASELLPPLRMAHPRRLEVEEEEEEEFRSDGFAESDFSFTEEQAAALCSRLHDEGMETDSQPTQSELSADPGTTLDVGMALGKGLGVALGKGLGVALGAVAPEVVSPEHHLASSAARGAGAHDGGADGASRGSGPTRARGTHRAAPSPSQPPTDPGSDLASSEERAKACREFASMGDTTLVRISKFLQQRGPPSMALVVAAIRSDSAQREAETRGLDAPDREVELNEGGAPPSRCQHLDALLETFEEEEAARERKALCLSKVARLLDTRRTRTRDYDAVSERASERAQLADRVSNAAGSASLYELSKAIALHPTALKQHINLLGAVDRIEEQLNLTLHMHMEVTELEQKHLNVIYTYTTLTQVCGGMLAALRKACALNRGTCPDAAFVIQAFPGICMLSERDAANCALVNAGILHQVKDFMKLNRQIADIQAQGCRLMVSLLEGGQRYAAARSNQTQFAATIALNARACLPAVLAAMTLHQDNKQLQRVGCRVLRTFSFGGVSLVHILNNHAAQVAKVLVHALGVPEKQTKVEAMIAILSLARLKTQLNKFIDELDAVGGWSRLMETMYVELKLSAKVNSKIAKMRPRKLKMLLRYIQEDFNDQDPIQTHVS